MKSYQQLIGGLLFVFSTSCLATDFEAIGTVGLDSNALELSDELFTVQQEFALGGIYSKSHWGEWLNWDIKSEKAEYFDDSRIDWYQSTIDLSIKNDFSLLEIPFDYAIGINYGKRDETYVARETGLIATYQQRSIADRFDHELSGYYANLSYPLRSDTNIYLEYRNQDKNYRTYSYVGLDDLDNREQTATFGVTFSPRENGQFYLKYNQTIRNYLNRQDRDLEGMMITDSRLAFNLYSVDVGYNFHTEDNVEWNYQFRYVNRTTNGTQYFDSQRGEISIAGRFYISDLQRLSAKLEYQSFFYDESAEQPMTYFEKEDFERQGGTIELEYSLKIATLFTTNFSFYTNLRYSEYDSDDVFYAFTRNRLSVGLRWALD